MIIDRLQNQGKIREEFKLASFQKSNIVQGNLFEENYRKTLHKVEISE